MVLYYNSSKSRILRGTRNLTCYNNKLYNRNLYKHDKHYLKENNLWALLNGKILNCINNPLIKNLTKDQIKNLSLKGLKKAQTLNLRFLIVIKIIRKEKKEIKNGCFYQLT